MNYHSNQREKDKLIITRKLAKAGIKVQTGKKRPRNGEYSGIIGNSKKVLELKI